LIDFLAIPISLGHNPKASVASLISLIAYARTVIGFRGER